jgi:hypothetical protein
MWEQKRVWWIDYAIQSWKTDIRKMMSLQRESTGHHTVSQCPQSAETNGNVNVTTQTNWQVCIYNWANLILGGISTGTWPSRLREPKKLWQLKYGHESHGTQTHERLHWWDLETTENYRPDLSSERASHINKHQELSKNNLNRKEKNLLWFPDGCLTPRQTGQLTVGHNITLTLEEINTGTWPSRWGGSQIWDCRNMVMNSTRLRHKKVCIGAAQQQL